MMKMKIPNWEEICSIIEPEDLYTPDEDHGIETNPHVTILYGFYAFVHVNDIMKILRTFDRPKVYFKGIETFTDSPDFDVVMIKVESEDLRKMNTALSQLPNEETFPTYEPHCTIAYVKKGMAEKYKGMEIDFPKELVLKDALYSSSDGIKITIGL